MQIFAVENLLVDHGPWYAETDLSRFPVEPANTLSNLIFLFVLIAAVRRVRAARLWSPFFLSTVVILAVGWIGGTVYHATRSSVVWLMMDYVPISVLCLMGTGRFTMRLKRPNRGKLAWCLVVILALYAGLAAVVSNRHVLISLGYAALAALVALPAAFHCWQRGGEGRWNIVGAVVAFGVALLFRLWDAKFVGAHPVLGTHFLWHLFGGLAAYWVLDYLLKEAEQAGGKLDIPATHEPRTGERL